MTQTQATKSATRSPETHGPRVRERAPEFPIGTPSGPVSIAELASGVGTLVLVSLDSYQFHPG